MSNKDYYSVLGLTQDASPEEIRRAFRELAKEHHPDVNPESEQAEARFKEAAEAYAVLSDAEQRRRYDEKLNPKARVSDWNRRSYDSRAQPFVGEQTFFGDMETGGDWFSEIFEALWGSSTGRRFGRREYYQAPARRGADLTEIVEISLGEAYTGTSRVLEIVDGHGNEYQLVVDIPAGVVDGYRIRLPGEGEEGRNGGPPGDLFLEVQVLPDARFRRRGDDLYTEQRVNLTTMVLGGTVNVDLPNGSVLLDLPPESADGDVIRVVGGGMPQLGRPAQRGDLYVEVHVQIPRPLSKEEKRLFRRLARLETRDDQRSEE